MGEHLDPKLQQLLAKFDDFRGPVMKFLQRLLEVGGTFRDLQLLADNRAALTDALKAAKMWAFTRILPPLQEALPDGEIKPWSEPRVPVYLLSEGGRHSYRGTIPTPPPHPPLLSIADLQSGYTTYAIAIVGIVVIGSNGGRWWYQLVVRPTAVDSGDSQYTWDLWMQGHYLNGGTDISREDMALNVKECIRGFSGEPPSGN